jgi:ParB/RepB/Spo0J family partition protein
MQTHRFRVSELRSHPHQNETYGDLPQHEFAALKEDIARRGVRHPIEVTMSGMIVDGHQRVRACKELGIEEIDAIICQDEAQEAIDESFVLGNLMRRHLDPVAKAKAIQTLVEIERRRSGANQDAEHDGDLRDRIAMRLGGTVSGRTVDRLLQLLRLPRAICQAVSAGELPMTKALRVEKLPGDIQQVIADRIAAGAAARAVVAEYLPRKPPTQQETPADLYQMLVDFLGDNISILDAACDALAGVAGNHERTADVLGKTESFCRTMQFRELSAHSESLNEVRELIG